MQFEPCGILKKAIADARIDEGEGCNAVRIPMFDWFGYFRREREAYDRDYGITEEAEFIT